MDNYGNSQTTKFCADLFPAHRYPSIKFKKGLEGAKVNSMIKSGFDFLKITFQQIKWTVSKKWKRNSEKF